jgi:tagatose-1,6-bisphosphate aldolase
MAKYQAKTTENKLSVKDFIKKISDAQRQKDALLIVDIMEKQSGYPAKMWGSAIIGFGSYHYVYESGHEGDAPLVGFSPRKTEFALYLSSAFDKREELLQQFGKHKTAKSCVYIKKIEDIKVDILKKMVAATIKHTKAKYA